jgi:hypothetical protein
MPSAPIEALGAIQTVKLTRQTATVNRADGSAETTVTWSGQIVLSDKLRAAKMLSRHPGPLCTDLPALEVLFNRLPPEVGSVLRRLVTSGSIEAVDIQRTPGQL